MHEKERGVTEVEGGGLEEMEKDSGRRGRCGEGQRQWRKGRDDGKKWL